MASRDPALLCPTLFVFWGKFKKRYEEKFMGRRVLLTCTQRPVEEQQSLFAVGRTKPGKIITKCDGVKIKSKHNYTPAHAFDFAVFLLRDGKWAVSWDEQYYKDGAALIKELGYEGRIRSGGWFSFRDWPHMEVVWPSGKEPFTKD